MTGDIMGIKCMERTVASSEKDIQFRELAPTSGTEPGQPFIVRCLMRRCGSICELSSFQEK